MTHHIHHKAQGKALARLNIEALGRTCYEANNDSNYYVRTPWGRGLPLGGPRTPRGHREAHFLNLNLFLSQ